MISLIGGIKNIKKSRNRPMNAENWWPPDKRGWRMGKTGEGEWKVQASRYKMCKSRDKRYKGTARAGNIINNTATAL